MFAAHLALNSACSTCIATRRLQPKTQQHSRGRAHNVVRAFWPFTQAKKAPSAAVVKEAKTRLAQLSGKKYGHDLSESQKEDVREVLKELEAIVPGNIRQKELLGSNWKLLYTESTGSSGGKVGPLVGQVDQVFPEDQPGIYINKLQLGPLRADLSANYSYSGSSQIDVSFIDISAYLGPIQLIQKDFGGRSGSWILKYHDEDLRILYTNQGNVFVLTLA